MGLCTKLIAADIEQNCTNPIFAGLEMIGYIINKSEIASITKSDNKVSAIALATGKTAFHIYNDGKQPFNGTKTTMAEGTISNKFTNEVSFVVADDGPAVQKDIIEKLANGEFVVIVENKWHNAVTDNTFQIYGLQKGLRASAIENDKYSADTDGGWEITLTEEGVPQSAIYFFDTDVATSRTALETLC